jgi:hypothetical protein
VRTAFRSLRNYNYRVWAAGALVSNVMLALAVQHEGRLVTFDTGIPLAAVRKATTQKLLIL